jgi:hypothetical protein
MATEIVGETVLSCPGCDSWQLHYNEVALVVDGTFTSAKHLDVIVEQLLKEHVGRECPNPRMIQILLRDRAARN